MTDSTGTYNFTLVDPEFKTSEKSEFDRMLSVFRNSTVTLNDSCKKRRKSGKKITRLNEMNPWLCRFALSLREFSYLVYQCTFTHLLSLPEENLYLCTSLYFIGPLSVIDIRTSSFMIVLFKNKFVFDHCVTCIHYMFSRE